MTDKEIIDGLYEIKNWKCNGDSKMHSIIRGAIDLLEQTRWIPVSERMPEEDGFYLVSIETMKNPPEITTFTGISHFIVHNEFLGEMNDFDRENVIAWMPLPQPYVPDINVGEMRGVKDEI